MNKKYLKYISGLTLVEILIGIIITTIMMAAMYTSYNVVNQSYNQVSEKAKISRSSRDLVSMMMRDIRMAGFKYYAGTSEIAKYATDTTQAPDSCPVPGIPLPKLSYLLFQDGFDQLGDVTYEEDRSHNPLVIRRNTLGPNRATDTTGVLAGNNDLCCDQIQIVYEDFNQNELEQPYLKYRITYFAKRTATDEVVTSGGIKKINRYGVYKLIQGWQQERVTGECEFPTTGSWTTNCDECTAVPVLIRDHVEDMEFIPFDEDGRVIKTTDNKYPAPEIASMNSRMYDIRGVDIKLIFRSRDSFFTRNATRASIGLSSDREKSYDDRFLRDSVIVSVHTRNIGGEAFQ